MNNIFYKVSLFVISIFVLTGCVDDQEVDYVSRYDPDDARETLGYSYRDAPDISKYNEYINERANECTSYLVAPRNSYLVPCTS